ncbi:MAG: Nif3-like dinuclear metal center hexameric protein [Armatimonadota bacterium]
MTARQLSDALHTLWPHCDPNKTVDRVIAGDSNQEINGVAVCWMPYSATLRQAAAMGVNTVVTHEPTFYDHWELKKEVSHARYESAKREKEALIEALGLTVIRCHDVWDAIQEIGVPFEWGRFLGLSDLVKSEQYVNLYRIEQQTAITFTQYFASRTAVAGQATVEFYGDPERLIETVGIGTGCYSDAMRLYDLGADLAVSVDDIARAWIIGEYCHDTGSPMIVVNHGVSEDCAMVSLRDKIQELLPNLRVCRIEQGCSYREISAKI